MFEPFIQEFGSPRPGTAAGLDVLGLSDSDGLRLFADEVGGGIFAEGLVSLLSVRERVDDLGGWQHWLPPGSRLFGCLAFGFLMTTTGDDVWLVNTQYGEILESDLSIPEAIVQLTSPTAGEDILRSRLFRIWNEMGRSLPSDSVLCPTPAIALGGTWTATTLSIMTLPVYLSFTGQMFSPDGGMPARVHRVEE